MEISRQQQVYLALGTNLGDRLINLKKALQALLPDIVPVRCSPVYETAPWGVTDQPAFLNIAVEVRTDLTPRQVLKVLKKIEAQLGRVPTIRNGPRIIDLDILFYSSHIEKHDILEIPHPRMEGRGFVLKPLADLAADFVNPASGETIQQMLQRCDLTGISLYPLPEGFQFLES